MSSWASIMDVIWFGIQDGLCVWDTSVGMASGAPPSSAFFPQAQSGTPDY